MSAFPTLCKVKELCQELGFNPSALWGNFILLGDTECKWKKNIYRTENTNNDAVDSQ